MSETESQRPITMKVVQAALSIIGGLLGLFTAFVSQASTPHYRRLFWGILPFAVADFTLTSGYALCVRDWTRWLCLGIGIVATASFAEMLVRVWL